MSELREWILSIEFFFWGNNIEYRLLNHKYKTIFKSEKNLEKLIHDWDVKVEKNWRKLLLEDQFSLGGF
jgi:hypothetical protein